MRLIFPAGREGDTMYGIAVENLVNQFEARFQPGGDDRLYFHSDGASGLPCSAEEALALSQKFERTVRRAARAMVAWVIAAGVGLGVAAGVGLYEPSQLEAAAIFLAPFPFAVLAVKRASDAPLEAFRLRGAIAPPREAGETRRTRFAALPDGVVVAMVGVNGLLIWSYLRDGFQEADWLYVGVNLLTAALLLMILKAKLSR